MGCGQDQPEVLHLDLSTKDLDIVCLTKSLGLTRLEPCRGCTHRLVGLGHTPRRSPVGPHLTIVICICVRAGL